LDIQRKLELSPRSLRRIEGKSQLSLGSALIDGLPQDKQRKYARALALLDIDFPAPALAAVAAPGAAPRGPLPQLAVQAANVARSRAPVNVANIENANVVNAPLQAASFGFASAPTPAVNTNGYEIILDPDRVLPVIPGVRLPPLNAIEIGRLNDSFRRVRRAVELAISALHTMKGTDRSFEKTQYTLYFGVHSDANQKTIRRLPIDRRHADGASRRNRRFPIHHRCQKRCE
jgi:hypothetical protein